MKNNVFFLIIILLFINDAYSCSCIGKKNLKDEIRKTDVLLVGKVIEKNIFTVKIDFVPEEFYIKKAEYTIQIKIRLKGEVINDTIKIITGVGNGDCGVNFLLDNDYIIYGVFLDKYFEDGNIVDKFISTDICTRTRLYDEYEIKKIKKCIKREKKLKVVANVPPPPDGADLQSVPTNESKQHKKLHQ